MYSVHVSSTGGEAVSSDTRQPRSAPYLVRLVWNVGRRRVHGGRRCRGPQGRELSLSRNGGDERGPAVTAAARPADLSTVDGDERTCSITAGRREDGSKYSPRLVVVRRIETAVVRDQALRATGSRGHKCGCGHGLRFPDIARRRLCLNTNNHVRPNRHRRLRGTVLRVRQRDRVPERPVPQDLNPQWSRMVSSLCDYLQGSYYCAPESLTPDEIIPPSGTLDQDLDNLATIVEDDVPAYVLVRLDEPPSDWLAIYYVPDNAKVRDKVRPRHYAE